MTTRKAEGSPLLIFNMELDSNHNAVVGLNHGRLSLFDDWGLIGVGRWVSTSSFQRLQKISDWEITNGVLPPNYALKGGNWYWVDTELIIQPGQPVSRGFLIKYQDSIELTTIKGNIRSEFFIHPDENFLTSPGSAGCICMLPGGEWDSFEKTFVESCSHLEKVRLGVIYSF